MDLNNTYRLQIRYNLLLTICLPSVRRPLGCVHASPSSQVSSSFQNIFPPHLFYLSTVCRRFVVSFHSQVSIHDNSSSCPLDVP